jgi:catechol 2,3-dioxygenase-like lactoylglutathione lyase family enzyme
MSGELEPSRVFHWGYVVASMERALATWERMGAAILVPPAVDPIQNVTCALLLYRNAVPIELVAPLPEGPNPVANRLKKGGGLDHVCLFSDDLEADLDAMRCEGGAVVVEPAYAAVFDRRLAFVATRAGLTVELMTRAPVGRHAKDPLAGFLALAG